MSIEENFNKRNSELQQKIELEIEKVKVGQSKKNIVQLQTILTELQKSNTQKNIILSYPQIIVDSWDYSDQLGMELLGLAEFIKKYNSCSYLCFHLKMRFFYDNFKFFSRLRISVNFFRISCPKFAFWSSHEEKYQAQERQRMD